MRAEMPVMQEGAIRATRDMIKLTETREITPYVSLHPEEVRTPAVQRTVRSINTAQALRNYGLRVARL